MKDNVYTEFGIDFDNNKFGIGYSTEFENADGTEYRVKKIVPIKNKHIYFRLWVAKRVLIISKNGIILTHKNRNNFKLLIGIAGLQ